MPVVPLAALLQAKLDQKAAAADEITAWATKISTEGIAFTPAS